MKKIALFALLAFAGAASAAPALRESVLLKFDGKFGSAAAKAKISAPAGAREGALTVTLADGRSFSAPKAACLGCDGLGKPGEWAPARASFIKGMLVVEYTDAKDGSALKASYLPDTLSGAPRLASAQRIFVDATGRTRLVAVDFVSGTRVERNGVDPDFACRVSADAPKFAALSLAAFNDGAFIPKCSAEPEPRPVASRSGR